jgi:zinc transport system substrate-binding protein
MGLRNIGLRSTGFRLFHLLAACVFMLHPAVSQAKPLILSSLKPLTLIAQEIAGDRAEVDTLLPASASHHDYPLKVSDHVRLRNADLFVWVGPELESFLQKPLSNLIPAKVLTTYDLPGISWPVETTSSEGGGEHHHAKDPHIWLDPRNAVVIARALVERLILLDAANAPQYKANLQAFTVNMMNLDNKLQAQLKPVTSVGFAVYHEGFAHFVDHYGLRQLDYLMLTPEQKPGARHMHQLRERLANDGSCLFIEPYNNTQAARSLAQELRLRVGTLDALGTQGAKTYAQLLEQMAVDFSTCLANRGH